MNKRLMKRVFYAIFSILQLLSSFLIKSKNFKILGNFMMVGKKQMKHLSTCWRVLANTDADEDLAIRNYRYYRTSFSCSDTVFWYRNSSVMNAE
jgi:hypothetical protein